MSIFSQTHLKILFGICLLFLSVNLMGQVIPNSDFEDWLPSGAPPPFNWEYPVSWTTTNPLTEFVGAGISRWDEGASGATSVRIISTAIQEAWPSILCLGDCPSAGGFVDPSLDIIGGGMPIESHPTALTGQFKYPSNDPGDKGRAVVILKKYNLELGKHDTVGLGMMEFGATEEFTPFNLPIEILMPDETADSVVIAFYSTRPENPFPPTQSGAFGLFLDQLIFIEGEGTGINPIFESQLMPRVFPNPVHNFLNIQTGEAPLNWSIISIFSLEGQLIKQVPFAEQINVSHFSPGIYLVEFANKDGYRKRDKIIIEH